MVYDKTIHTGRRFEESLTTETSNGTVPDPYIFSATDMDGVVTYYVNNGESYTVPWNENVIYYVMYIAKHPGRKLLNETEFLTIG